MGVVAEQMAEKDRQMAEKDRQMAKLADLYAAALKQIQDLTAELQEAKGIISAAVARSIGANRTKKETAAPSAAQRARARARASQVTTNARALRILKE